MMLVDVATQRAEFPVVSREVASECSSFRTPLLIFVDFLWIFIDFLWMFNDFY